MHCVGSLGEFNGCTSMKGSSLSESSSPVCTLVASLEQSSSGSSGQLFSVMLLSVWLQSSMDCKKSVDLMGSWLQLGSVLSCFSFSVSPPTDGDKLMGSPDGVGNSSRIRVLGDCDVSVKVLVVFAFASCFVVITESCEDVQHVDRQLKCLRVRRLAGRGNAVVGTS